MGLYGLIPSFLGAGVEFIEALTIIMAVGAVRGWKSSITGGLSAVVVMGALVAIIGAPLVRVMGINWVQLIVGLFMLLFGIRWLHKAILRYSGLVARHNESDNYDKEMQRQKEHGNVSKGLDKFAFVTSFSGTFLEGLEAVFIVITFGVSTNSMSSSIIGAAAALAVVVILGIVLRKPLAKIPENTMKYVVGVMLTSFGAFWIGESMNLSWPQKDLSILYIVATMVAVTFLIVWRVRGATGRSSKSTNQGVGM